MNSGPTNNLEAGVNITVPLELLQQVIEAHAAQNGAGGVLVENVTFELVAWSGSPFVSDCVRVVAYYLPPPLPLRKERPRAVGVVLAEKIL